MVSLLPSCSVETVHLYALGSLGSPAFALLLSLCRLEEVSLETLQGVGGIVKATAELSCFLFQTKSSGTFMLLCLLVRCQIKQTVPACLPWGNAANRLC